MNIQFASVDEQFIKSMVEHGYYSNATELVRDAVRRLRENQGNMRLQQLQAALNAGEEDIAAGRYMEWEDDSLDNAMVQAKEKVKKGVRLNPDVLP